MRQNTFNTGISYNNAQSNPIGIYQSMIVSKGRVSGSKLSSTDLSKYPQRSGSPSKINSQIHQIKQKIFQISKMLSQHSQDIAMLKQSKQSLSSYSSCDTLRSSNQSTHFKEVPKEMDNIIIDFQTQLNIEIKKIKKQIFEIIPTHDQILYLTHGLQLKIDNFKSHIIPKQIQQINTKINNQTILLKQQLSHRIKSLHEANRKVFLEIQKDMKQFNIQIQKLGSNSVSIFTSNKKFYSPIILKYKEYMERIGQKKEIILNEMSYYIDNEGFLLDNSCSYLVGKDGKQIQLDKKHLDLLKSHKILN